MSAGARLLGRRAKCSLPRTGAADAARVARRADGRTMLAAFAVVGLRAPSSSHDAAAFAGSDLIARDSWTFKGSSMERPLNGSARLSSLGPKETFFLG